MSDMPAIDTMTHEGKLREMLTLHNLHPRVVGFDVRFDNTWDGDPALWILLHTRASGRAAEADGRAFVGLMRDLSAKAREIVPDRFAYIHFVVEPKAMHQRLIDVFTPRALLQHADLLMWNDDPVSARRVVSASYYALFHLLTLDAASELAGGQSGTIQARIRRGAQHREMRRICQAIATSGQNVPPLLEGVLVAPVSPSLVIIADAFARLQEARHTADYDIDTDLSMDDAEAYRNLAHEAFDRWQDIKSQPNTRAFLTALLLADRWTRRG